MRLWFWQSINFGPGSKSKTLVNGNAPSTAEVFERFYGHSVPQGIQSKISEQMGCRLALAVRNQPAGAVSNWEISQNDQSHWKIMVSLRRTWETILWICRFKLSLGDKLQCLTIIFYGQHCLKTEILSQIFEDDHSHWILERVLWW